MDPFRFKTDLFSWVVKDFICRLLSCREIFPCNLVSLTSFPGICSPKSVGLREGDENARDNAGLVNPIIFPLQ